MDTTLINRNLLFGDLFFLLSMVPAFGNVQCLQIL